MYGCAIHGTMHTYLETGIEPNAEWSAARELLAKESINLEELVRANWEYVIKSEGQCTSLARSRGRRCDLTVVMDARGRAPWPHCSIHTKRLKLPMPDWFKPR